MLILVQTYVCPGPCYVLQRENALTRTPDFWQIWVPGEESLKSGEDF